MTKRQERQIRVRVMVKVRNRVRIRVSVRVTVRFANLDFCFGRPLLWQTLAMMDRNLQNHL